MEFDDQEEEGEVTLPPPGTLPGSYDVSHIKIAAPCGRDVPRRRPKYKECLKNHAVGIGGHAVDGCGEFMAAGEEGSLDALKCAACNCHRNFHRRECDDEYPGGVEPAYPQLPTVRPSYLRAISAAPQGSGYLHVSARPSPAHPLAHHHPQPLYHHHHPLVLSSLDDRDQHEETVNHHGGGGMVDGGLIGLVKKRFRTKFSQEQKDRMLEFAEKLGWRIQKHDEAAVQQFCMETCVKRHVLKVWMHNNKHTLGKKLQN